MKKFIIFLCIFSLFVCATEIAAHKIETKYRHKSYHKKHHYKKNNHRSHKKVKQRQARKKVAHDHYNYLPRRGAVVKSVHKNARIVRYKGANRYRYHSGVWYKPYKTKWIVTQPAFGLRIANLPVSYRTVFVGRKTYYYYYGTYYVRNSQKEFEVVEAPLGAEIDSLPEGYNEVAINGDLYYELDGVYYSPAVNQDKEEVLVVVENPLA